MSSSGSGTNPAGPPLQESNGGEAILASIITNGSLAAVLLVLFAFSLRKLFPHIYYPRAFDGSLAMLGPAAQPEKVAEFLHWIRLVLRTNISMTIGGLYAGFVD